MKTCKVGFSRPKKASILSLAIMKFMGKGYSHTYFLFDVVSTGQKVIYHANGRGVHCLEYGKFKERNLIIDEIVVDEKNRTDALHFCINNLGNSYSLVALVATLLNIKFGDGTKTFICSELVARALKLDIPNYDTVTPDQIQAILTKP